MFRPKATVCKWTSCLLFSNVLSDQKYIIDTNFDSNNPIFYFACFEMSAAYYLR